MSDQLKRFEVGINDDNCRRFDAALMVYYIEQVSALERENGELKAEVERLRADAINDAKDRDRRTAECERWADRCAELRRIIEDAPHEGLCNSNRVLSGDQRCDCFKSKLPK